MDSATLARRLVVMAKTCDPLLGKFSEDEKQVVIDLMKYLGADVVKMKVRNELHPSVVCGAYLLFRANGQEAPVSTKWSVEMIQRIKSSRLDESSLVADTVRRIAWARPMDPILLTRDGEELLEDGREVWRSNGRNIDPMTNLADPEDQVIPNSAGRHRYCCGKMFRRSVAKNSFVIYCEDCGLRVVVPNTVTTFRELRKYTTDLFRTLPDK